MSYSVFEHLSGIVAVILFIWSAVLVWASWQLGRVMRSLAQERRQLRKWKRWLELSQIQQSKWQ
jgi:hypothetical protein